MRSAGERVAVDEGRFDGLALTSLIAAVPSIILMGQACFVSLALALQAARRRGSVTPWLVLVLAVASLATLIFLVIHMSVASPSMERGATPLLGLSLIVNMAAGVATWLVAARLCRWRIHG